MSNENTDLRENLSELDKIFIPEDLDGNLCLEDLTNYKQGIKFWRTVPKNYSIVRQNIFTQNVKNGKGHGIKFHIPIFTRTILVPRHDATKKYENMQAVSLDKVTLQVNFSVVMQISDPAKYITEGKHQNKQLDSLIKRLLLDYASRFEYAHSITGNCNMDDFDPADELRDFEEQYGINVKKVLIEKVELPENIRKQQDDLVEARKKQEVKDVELQTAKNEAITQAEIKIITANAEAEALATKLAKVISALRTEGCYTDETLADAVKAYIYATTGNVIFTGNNQDAMNIAAGITGGGHTRARTPNNTNPAR